MNFMVRPSKSFLYDVLENELAAMRGAVALDAASANFKNRRMFRTRFYYGVDFDLELLKQGLARHSDDRTFGIHADLARLDAIPDNSADVAVSTNTLYQMQPASRKQALEHLCRITRTDGKLFCQLELDEDLDELLPIIHSHFSDVFVRYYRNPISRFYEWIFERDGYLGSHPVAGCRPFRLLAWLLSRTEYLTWRFRAGNRRAVVVAERKIAQGENHEFDLSGLPHEAERIYNLLEKSS